MNPKSANYLDIHSLLYAPLSIYIMKGRVLFNQGYILLLHWLLLNDYHVPSLSRLVPKLNKIPFYHKKGTNYLFQKNQRCLEQKKEESGSHGQALNNVWGSVLCCQCVCRDQSCLAWLDCDRGSELIDYKTRCCGPCWRCDGPEKVIQEWGIKFLNEWGKMSVEAILGIWYWFF